jgi:glycosyltransferase involved in cell wall biosynthesis
VASLFGIGATLESCFVLRHANSVPTVSVVIVFHRRNPHFPRAVESVRQQSLADWELVLVDNGTSLGKGVLEGSAASDDRIHVVSLASNEGIARGINSGVAASRGEFIALLDYDDVALPRRLESQVALLKSDSRLGLVNCGAETIDEYDRVLGREFALHEHDAQLPFSTYGTPVVSPAYAGRRQVFLEFPHRSEFKWGSDYDFFARAVEKWRVGGVSEPLLQYRRYPDQTTVTHGNGLVLNQCATRLVTARRRAGRSEGMDELRHELQASVADLDEAELYERFARRCLKERFFPLASYHARRLLGAKRDLSSLRTALRILRAAVSEAPRDKKFLIRLFLRGPLVAHRLVT